MANGIYYQWNVVPVRKSCTQLFYRKKSIMIEKSNILITNITKNNQINSIAEEIDDSDLEIANVNEIYVGAQEPELEIDNPDSVVTDVVAQDSVLENSPAVAQSNNYQTMIQASIQAIQNSVGLQQQLTLNSYNATTQNLNFIYSKERRVAENYTTDGIFQMLHKLFPEHNDLIQEMREGSSRKPGKTNKTRSLSAQYLNNVIEMLKSVQ